MTPEAAVAGLAASLLAHEVTPETLASLQKPEITPLLCEIEPEIKGLLAREWSDQDFEDAAVEFCRLFILEPRAPARAAAYEEPGQPLIASRIQGMIDAGHLKLPERFRSLAPDHVAVLLLIYRSLDEPDSLAFKEQNLSWLPAFTGRLLKNEQHVLYRLVARSLEALS